MSWSRIVGAWMAMLVLGALLWQAGGSRLAGPPATPTPEVSQPVAESAPSPSPAPRPRPSSSPASTTLNAHPGEFVGRWVELDGSDNLLMVGEQGDNLEVVGPDDDVAVFQPAGSGFEQVVGDTIRRLELNEDGDLVLTTTSLGGAGQSRTSRVFTPQPEGDIPWDPNSPAP